MDSFLQDLRYAIRSLLKSPRFTAVATVALAVGIGANTAIFSLINAVLYKPMPGIKNPNQLVSLYRMQKNDAFDVLGFPDYADYRDRNLSLSGLAAHSAAPISLSRGEPERLLGDVVTGNYFSVLGVTASYGRLILPEDDTDRGAHPVAVFSYGLWQRKFGADPNAVGKEVTLNGYPFTVIGVASKQFTGTVAGVPFDVWIPTSMLDQAMPRVVGHHFFEERATGWLRVFGRLKSGVSVQQAEVEMKGIARQLELAYPQTNAGRTIAIVRGVGLDPDDQASLGGFLGLLFAGVGMLLLIACANVAGLLLVRATGRQREIAVRLALGATRGRLVRQLLTEGLLLALVGGGLGLLMAPWAVGLAVAWTQPASVIRDLNSSLDARVFIFTYGVCVIAGIAFALIPALRAASPDLVSSLKQGSAASGRRHSPLQRTLAAGQVAVSFVLLVGAGLLLRSMQKILGAGTGFNTSNVLLMNVDLSIQGYSVDKGKAFCRQLLKRLEAVPGVTSASLAMTVPPSDWGGRVSIFYPGQEPAQDVLRGHEFELGIRVDVDPISPNYFRTLEIPILQGRDFSEHDGELDAPRDQDGNFQEDPRGPSRSSTGAPGVVIVSHKLAERLWPGENAVGKRISWPSMVGPPRAPLEVVGVAADTRYRSVVGDFPLLMYVPLLQDYDGRPTLAVRTATDAAGLAAAIRREVSTLDKNLPVFRIKTMQQQMAASLWQQRTATSLVSAFGVLALLLATMGLYGVVAHFVAQRTQEIGIRMALGAERNDILKLVVRRGVSVVLTGLAAGLVVSLFLTRILSSFLYEISPVDPVAFAAVALLLATVTLAASYVPGRQATSVDPVVALAHE